MLNDQNIRIQRVANSVKDRSTKLIALSSSLLQQSSTSSEQDITTSDQGTIMKTHAASIKEVAESVKQHSTSLNDQGMRSPSQHTQREKGTTYNPHRTVGRLAGRTPQESTG